MRPPQGKNRDWCTVRLAGQEVARGKRRSVSTHGPKSFRRHPLIVLARRPDLDVSRSPARSILSEGSAVSAPSGVFLRAVLPTVEQLFKLYRVCLLIFFNQMHFLFAFKSRVASFADASVTGTLRCVHGAHCKRCCGVHRGGQPSIPRPRQVRYQSAQTSKYSRIVPSLFFPSFPISLSTVRPK